MGVLLSSWGRTRFPPSGLLNRRNVSHFRVLVKAKNAAACGALEDVKATLDWAVTFRVEN
jgi:hypothetical protein